MKPQSSTSENVKKSASYVMLFLSSLGLGYSIVKYFVLDNPSLAITLPLFIVSISIFVKTLLPLIKENNNK